MAGRIRARCFPCCERRRAAKCQGEADAISQGKRPVKSKTESFIAEFPLRTTAADERALRIRLDAARNIYNAALGEALRRLDLMRQSKAWQAARAAPKGKERTDAFRAIGRRFGFSWIALKGFTQDCRNACWIKDHLGSQECQAITKRAFGIVEQYSFGKR